MALELLAGMRLTAPVTAVRLEVEGLEPGAGRQVDLWRGGDAAGEEIGGAAARLRARFGRTAVRRAELTVDPGDLPERRFRWAEPVAAEVDGEGRGSRVAGAASVPPPSAGRRPAARTRRGRRAGGARRSDGGDAGAAPMTADRVRRWSAPARSGAGDRAAQRGR